MKICPECQERYDDDVVSCAKDGEELVELPQELSGNPRLREPVAASPADRTSMIDLEAIEAKRKSKSAPAGDGGGENQAGDEQTPPPAQPMEADGDATGTLQRTRAKKKRKGTVHDNVVADDVADAIPDDRRVNEEPTNKDMASRSRLSRLDKSGFTRAGQTSVTMVDPDAPREGTRAGTRTGLRAPNTARARSLSGTQAAFLVLFGLLALMAAIVFFARATAVLTVTTVPPGAAVLLDGAPVGLSPIQKRVRTSSHTIELSLDGYEPFKEIVEVPSSGLPFLQPLQKKPPPPPPPPTAAQIADELVKAAKLALDARDLELAKRKLDEALGLSPGLPAALTLMTTVETAISKRADEARKAEQSAANGSRLKQARVLAAEGRQLYDKGALGPAKEKLYASLKLDADNSEPHRTLGRIFNREEQVDKVRYHLQRYLELGGADGDFKVREWLKTHPK